MHMSGAARRRRDHGLEELPMCDGLRIAEDEKAVARKERTGRPSPRPMDPFKLGTWRTHNHRGPARSRTSHSAKTRVGYRETAAHGPGGGLDASSCALDSFAAGAASAQSTAAAKARTGIAALHAHGLSWDLSRQSSSASLRREGSGGPQRAPPHIPICEPEREPGDRRAHWTETIRISPRVRPPSDHRRSVRSIWPLSWRW
ncbi:hypothetical protein FKP32DRAFT_44565 [Trametes sanguinea]|nr:hypothetical protein FKP32DRAFT_44565 [Trametes sanguinea]